MRNASILLLPDALLNQKIDELNNEITGYEVVIEASNDKPYRNFLFNLMCCVMRRRDAAVKEQTRRAKYEMQLLEDKSVLLGIPRRMRPSS